MFPYCSCPFHGSDYDWSIGLCLGFPEAHISREAPSPSGVLQRQGHHDDKDGQGLACACSSQTNEGIHAFMVRKLA